MSKAPHVRTLSILAMTLALLVLAPPADGGEVNIDARIGDTNVEQSIGIPESCRTVSISSVPPGVPEVPITAVEVCGDVPESVIWVTAEFDTACQCVTVWNPASTSQFDPSYIRVYTRSGVIQQQYPFGSSAMEVPRFCLYTNDPSYSGPPCLL